MQARASIRTAFDGEVWSVGKFPRRRADHTGVRSIPSFFVLSATTHLLHFIKREEKRVEEEELPHLARHPEGGGVGYCHTLIRVNAEWLKQTNNIPDIQIPTERGNYLLFRN